jgi:hypothetical protein
MGERIIKGEGPMYRCLTLFVLALPLIGLASPAAVGQQGTRSPYRSTPSYDEPQVPQEGVYQWNPPSHYGNNGHPFGGDSRGNPSEFQSYSPAIATLNSGWGGYGYGGIGWGGIGPGVYRGW